MNRKQVREAVFMTLFQTEFRDDVDIQDVLKQYCTIDQNQDEDEADIEPDISESDMIYVNSVISGVAENKSLIDEKIEVYAKDWSLERISKVDLSILRYCFYELMFMEKTTPSGIAINEAVELAKKYGSDKSKAFVNGVLSTLYKELHAATAEK